MLLFSGVFLRPLWVILTSTHSRLSLEVDMMTRKSATKLVELRPRHIMVALRKSHEHDMLRGNTVYFLRSFLSLESGADPDLNRQCKTGLSFAQSHVCDRKQLHCLLSHARWYVTVRNNESPVFAKVGGTIGVPLYECCGGQSLLPYQIISPCFAASRGDGVARKKHRRLSSEDLVQPEGPP